MLSLVMALAIAGPGQDVAAEKVFRAWIAKVRAANAISGKGEMVPRKEGQQTTPFEFRMMRPSYYDVSTPVQRWLSDGNAVYGVDKPQNTYTETTGLNPNQLRPPLAAGFEAFFQADTPEWTPKEYAFGEFDGKRVAVATMWPYKEIAIRIYLDPEKAMAVGWGQESADYKAQYRFTEVRLDPPMTADSFAWRAPEGAKRAAGVDYKKSLLPIGTQVPDFTLPLSRGGTVTLSELRRGKKATLVNFWFYGCGGCRAEFPHLQEFADKFGKDGFAMVSINFGDSKNTIQNYLEKNGFTFPVAMNGTGDADVVKALKVQAYPTNYLLDADGKIVEAFVGFSESQLKAAMAKMGFKL